MDFKPMKKDGKPGPDGLFGWESPRLRAALKAAKEAGKQMVAKGLTQAAYRTAKDCDMIARDLGAACVQAPAAEPAPAQLAGYGPWIRWNFDMDNVPKGEGRIILACNKDNDSYHSNNLASWDWTDHDKGDNIKWYCYKELA